jgi:hypothetical protein
MATSVLCWSPSIFRYFTPFPKILRPIKNLEKFGKGVGGMGDGSCIYPEKNHKSIFSAEMRKLTYYTFSSCTLKIVLSFSGAARSGLPM